MVGIQGRFLGVEAGMQKARVEAGMRKARGDERQEKGAANFFGCPFWVRCGLGGCRNEFVGDEREENVPETE